VVTWEPVIPLGDADSAGGLLSGLSPELRARLREARHPEWVDPMLATPTERRFSDPGWLFERKLDGIRCLAFRQGDRLRLLSRNQQRLDNTYPELADRIAAQAVDDFVLDGEVVAFENGRTSFALLQQRSGVTDARRARQSPVAVTYFVFDVLHLAGHDTRDLPLRVRKALLRRAIDLRAPLKYTRHRNGEGVGYFAHACSHGWEGLVAKRADSSYASRRSPNWLKFKCESGQELVIGGFTEPSGSRSGFGALLLGYHADGELRFAGKVGTGFDDKTLRELRRRLSSIEIERSPFADVRRFERGTHFVRPELVAQVGFTEWTRDGMLRHPRFLGLRTDKAASEVTRDMFAPASSGGGPRARPSRRSAR
jgi:DNA ligase D-like protein (predicted ligase)